MNYNTLIAPVVVTILLLLYFGFILLDIVNLPDSMGIGLLWVLIPLGLMGVSIFVFVERIREIRSGDEDDLGKY